MFWLYINARCSRERERKRLLVHWREEMKLHFVLVFVAQHWCVHTGNSWFSTRFFAPIHIFYSPRKKMSLMHLKQNNLCDFSLCFSGDAKYEADIIHRNGLNQTKNLRIRDTEWMREKVKPERWRKLLKHFRIEKKTKRHMIASRIMLALSQCFSVCSKWATTTTTHTMFLRVFITHKNLWSENQHHFSNKV